MNLRPGFYRRLARFTAAVPKVRRAAGGGRGGVCVVGLVGWQGWEQGRQQAWKVQCGAAHGLQASPCWSTPTDHHHPCPRPTQEEVMRCLKLCNKQSVVARAHSGQVRRSQADPTSGWAHIRPCARMHRLALPLPPPPHRCPHPTPPAGRPARQQQRRRAQHRDLPVAQHPAVCAQQHHAALASRNPRHGDGRAASLQSRRFEHQQR